MRYQTAPRPGAPAHDTRLALVRTGNVVTSVRGLTGRDSRKAVAAWLSEEGLVFVAGLIAALPVIVSTGHALVHHWVPVGDNASTAVRSYDVLTSHSPLLGQWTTSSEVVGHKMYSLGPLLNWA